MKKLILIAALSFSTAFACNDYISVYGESVGCEIKNENLYTKDTQENGNDIYKRYVDGDLVLIGMNGKIIDAAFTTYKEMHADELLVVIDDLSSKYGDPTFINGGFIWMIDNVNIVVIKKDESILVGYTSAN